MDTNSIIAIAGSVVLAVLVRVSNMVVEWLARVMKVEQPAAIVLPGQQDHPDSSPASPGGS
jgi:hypothetical protein